MIFQITTLILSLIVLYMIIVFIKHNKRSISKWIYFNITKPYWTRKKKFIQYKNTEEQSTKKLRIHHTINPERNSFNEISENIRKQLLSK